MEPESQIDRSLVEGRLQPHPNELRVKQKSENVHKLQQMQTRTSNNPCLCNEAAAADIVVEEVHNVTNGLLASYALSPTVHALCDAMHLQHPKR